MRGHAIECRINAEHPETFAPSPGRITGLNLPGGVGVRVDTAAYTDGVVPPYYDSLLAKLITHGNDRTEAISRMNRALDMFVVEGIHTSIPLHQRILMHEDFIAGSWTPVFWCAPSSSSKNSVYIVGRAPGRSETAWRDFVSA
jgi:acetyl-CoA carboxylase, biotin carboxylase subunit